ncbi:MAG: prepilin-type N-terminal cleavage/methylation domain-containing protein [Lachnospiraceae bacterium]|nr:prepilin-type N-terminal cleavage/methylation domain-containing protein [Lachnospiraceae bacterium]
MDEKGASLIELLVVLAIMALITAMSMPKLGLLQKNELEIEAAYLAAELRYAQELSYTVQQIHNEFPLVQADSTPRFVVQGRGYYIMQNGKMYHNHTLPERISIKTNRNNFIFSSGGTAQTVTITLEQGKKRIYVIVDIVGRIRVSDVPAV